MDGTYWDGEGKHQDLADKLKKLIPISGSVDSPHTNRALEKFRKASNCYYDLFNNGLCNRAAEFRRVFGFGGTSIAERYSNTDPKMIQLEMMMDSIILAAAEEQNIK